MSDADEVRRLEALWSEDFGDGYFERNRDATAGRETYWRGLHEQHAFASVLEVGCNAGANLHWLAQLVEPSAVFGVDINARALRALRVALPDVNTVHAPAAALPFRDGFVDLAFTTMVLIHQPPAALATVMGEVVRCSRRYVLCGEFYADEPEQVVYRGERDALFKRDWGALYQELFPELRLLDQRFESRDETGWNDVTFWLFEKT